MDLVTIYLACSFDPENPDHSLQEPVWMNSCQAGRVTEGQIFKRQNSTGEIQVQAAEADSAERGEGKVRDRMA